jgi:hypothetical protein
MASTADIQDQGLREALQGIETLIDDGAYASACKECADLYVEYLRSHPDPEAPNAGYNPGQFAIERGILWPRTGGISIHRDEAGVPSASYDKERFSLSEAYTYFEFVMDFLSKHQGA